MMDDAVYVARFVSGKIEGFYAHSNRSFTRSALAHLRQGIGKPPGSMPELWAFTLEGLPENLLSRNSQPSRGEWAVHTALTLFALHQQGNDWKEKPMSVSGRSFGKAVRQLAGRDPERSEAVLRRFNTVAMSDDMTALSWRIRGMIAQLKAKEIPLDYPALAKDFFWFQFSGGRDSVRLRWGQDYYHTPDTETLAAESEPHIRKDGSEDD